MHMWICKHDKKLPKGKSCIIISLSEIQNLTHATCLTLYISYLYVGSVITHWQFSLMWLSIFFLKETIA